jgi:hypothetical protein
MSIFSVSDMIEASHFRLVRRLVLRNNAINDEGAKTIADALINDSRLTRVSFLDLSANGIGDEGAKSIAGVLRNNTFLRHLILNGNWIGDEGAKSIAGALEENKSLRILSLEHTRINYDGAMSIVKALEKNSTLIQLSLPGRFGSHIKCTQEYLFQLRIEIAQRVAHVAAEFSSVALVLFRRFPSLPCRLLAEICANALATKVFEESSNAISKNLDSCPFFPVEIDEKRVCKFLIFESLECEFKKRLSNEDEDEERPSKRVNIA